MPADINRTLTKPKNAARSITIPQGGRGVMPAVACLPEASAG
jgi:hypothetical protein